MNAARYYVSGKVQGVWFRASAREQALALGLRGYARNLADGRVEVLAAGEAAALARLESWLHRGPANERDEAVPREDADASEAGDGFVCG